MKKIVCDDGGCIVHCRNGEDIHVKGTGLSRYLKSVAYYLFVGCDTSMTELILSWSAICFGLFTLLSPHDILGKYFSDSYIDVILLSTGTLQFLNICLPETHKHRINEVAALIAYFIVAVVWTYVSVVTSVVLGATPDRIPMLFLALAGWWVFIRINIPNILHGGQKD